MSNLIISRRDFLRSAGKTGLALGGGAALLSEPAWLTALLNGGADAAHAQGPLDEILKTAPRARYWTSTAAAGSDCLVCHEAGSVDGQEPDHEGILVKCLLCAAGCTIGEGERGRCRARMNVDGELRSLVYGRPITIHIDPIEKKPFYHFLPGSQAYSLATSGCPLRCKFCQNWEISQASPEDYSVRFTEPDGIVEASASRNVPIIAYTYNEPTVFTEYFTDIARAGRPRGIRSVIISCGFMNEAPLAEMCEVLDAIKIDLKGFSEAFYRDVCGAELRPVLRSIRQVAKSSTHLEIVNLVVPTLNDSDAMLRQLCEWVVGEIGPDVPVHFTRFHPDYQLRNLPPTPVSTLEKARNIAMEMGIHYAFVGNVPGHPGNQTYCPACRKVVIQRKGFFVDETHLKNGCCEACGAAIAGVWS